MKGVSRLLPPFLLIAVSVGVEGGCPHNAGKRAMECIGSMGDLGFGMKDDMVRPWDYQRTKMACDNHAFDLAIDCANSIVSECSENELGFLMNIPKMRRAVVKMCNSVDEMRPYVRCMHAQLDVVRRCAHEQKSILHAKIRAAGGDRQKKMKSLCSFTNNVYGCQAAPVRQHCGRRPAKFLLHFMNAFRPPSCPAPDGVSDIAPQFRISNGLILVCLLTSFLSCLYTRR